jgi:hypothetical protein
VITVWPAEYQQWAAKHSPGAAAPAMSRNSVRPVPPGGATFRITSPADGSTYLIDPTLRREFQAIPLRIASSSSNTITWEIDGKRAATSGEEGRPSWMLAPGRHIFIARNAAGDAAAASITVR